MNLVAVRGNLTRDAEMKVTTKGTTVVSFTVAVNTGYGQYKRTEFIPVTYFGKGAEWLVENHAQKGDQVIVIGSWRTEEWEKEGKKNKKVGILADSVEAVFTGKKEGGAGGPGSESTPQGGEAGEDLPF